MNAKESVNKTVPLDVYVGNRLRMGRKILGLTQSDIAKMTGISFQQVQKYESGKNQIAAKKLFEFANIFKKNVNFFFEGYGGKYGDDSTPSVIGLSDSAEKDIVYSEILKKDTVELIKGFSKLHDSVLRKKIIDLVNTMAETETPKKSARK